MKKTTLCYIERENKYLMLHRIFKENDANRDKWIGVGGKIEQGETPTECVIRETAEETGLSIAPQFRGIINFNSDIYGQEDMYLYTAYEFSGELTSCNEGELEWIDKDKLDSLNLWQGDRIFLKLIKDKNRPPFYLELYYKGDELTRHKLYENYNFEKVII